MKSLFLISLSQNIAVLTLVVTSLTQNWIKKGPNLCVCTNGDRKMKVNSKVKFQVKYSIIVCIKVPPRPLFCQAPPP